MEMNFRSRDPYVESNGKENEREADETESDQGGDCRDARESAHFDPNDNAEFDEKEKQAEARRDHPGDFNVDVQRRQRFAVLVLDPEVTLSNDTLQLGKNTHRHQQSE